MANIWQPPAGGYVDGPGLVCIGSIDTAPDHPYAMRSAWDTDGAIYGYREFADPPGSNVQLSVLGAQLAVCSSATDIVAADKSAIVTALNTGCNVNPYTVDHELNPQGAHGVDYGYADTVSLITCLTDGGSPSAAIKASMSLWGIYRTWLTTTTPEPTFAPLSQAFGAGSGDLSSQMVMAITFASADAANAAEAAFESISAAWFGA